MVNKKKHPLRASAIKFELLSKSAGSLRGSDYIGKKEFYRDLSFSGTEYTREPFVEPGWRVGAEAGI